MSNINTISPITSLSSAGILLSTDNIFIFTRDTNTETYSTISIPASQLSAQFINFELLDQIKNKYKELQQLSANFKQFLKDNYILSNDITNVFSTKEYFDSVYVHNNTTTTVLSNEFGDFATKSHASKYKEYALSEIAKYKCVAGNSVGALVTQAPGW